MVSTGHIRYDDALTHGEGCSARRPGTPDRRQAAAKDAKEAQMRRAWVLIVGAALLAGIGPAAAQGQMDAEFRKLGH